MAMEETMKWGKRVRDGRTLFPDILYAAYKAFNEGTGLTLVSGLDLYERYTAYVNARFIDASQNTEGSLAFHLGVAEQGKQMGDTLKEAYHTQAAEHLKQFIQNMNHLRFQLELSAMECLPPESKRLVPPTLRAMDAAMRAVIGVEKGGV